MKKFLVIACIILIMLTSCGYSKGSMNEALAEAEYEGYLRGYDEAKYEAKAELEQAIAEVEWEAKSKLEQALYEYENNGYDHAYEIGYEDGYSDCLEEYGLEDKRFNSDHYPQIEKD